MSRDLQAKVARQRRELVRLSEENEIAVTAVAVSETKAQFYETLASEAGAALKLLRQRFNVPGHEHVFNQADACVLCHKTGGRIRREAARKS